MELIDEIQRYLNCSAYDRLISRVGYKLFFPMEIKGDIKADITQIKHDLAMLTEMDPQGILFRALRDQLRRDICDDKEKDAG